MTIQKMQKCWRKIQYRKSHVDLIIPSPLIQKARFIVGEKPDMARQEQVEKLNKQNLFNLI